MKWLPIVQRFLSHGMLQSFLAKLFVPWEKNLCTIFDLTEFFVKLTENLDCKGFLQSFLSHGKKSFAKNQFDGKIWDCKGFLQSFFSHGKKSFAKRSIWRKNWDCKGFLQRFYEAWSKPSLFSNLYKNTTARSLFGMQRFCYIPWESFHPSGLRPLGWNDSLGMLQNLCIPHNDRAITYFIHLL